MQMEDLEGTINGNGKCPTCDPKMRQLSADLPNSLHTLTVLSCSLTGKIMDESNPPVYLPSGHLICEQAKKDLIAEQNQGKQLDELLKTKDKAEITFKCPFTKKLVAETDVRKVYFS